MKNENRELSDYLQQLLGDQYQYFLAADPELHAIRVNTLKIDVKTFQNKLQGIHVPFTPLPINPHGFIIKNDYLPLSHTLPYFTGKFNYQGISSQIPVLVLAPKPGETVLDMAASPGSKSTQIAALMKNSGNLFVNEVSIRRHQALVSNLLRNGVINDVLLQMPGQQIGNLFPEYFDRILVDAPCSSLGTFPSKSIQISQWWTRKAMRSLANLQYYLLLSAIKAAKVGGTIVYSTCSIAPEENEMIIDQLLKKYPIEIETIPFSDNSYFQTGLTTYQNQRFHPDLIRALRTFPHINSLEGFFITKLKKIGSMKQSAEKETMQFQPVYHSTEQEVAPVIQHLSDRWGIDADYFENFKFIIGQKRIWMLNREWENIPKNHFSKAGLLLAEKRMKEWKLTNASTQFLNRRIHNSIIELPEDTLFELFKTQKLHYPKLNNGYYILNVSGENIAIVSNIDNQLKIRLPHSFNLHLI